MRRCRFCRVRVASYIRERDTYYERSGRVHECEMFSSDEYWNHIAPRLAVVRDVPVARKGA